MEDGWFIYRGKDTPVPEEGVVRVKVAEGVRRIPPRAFSKRLHLKIVQLPSSLAIIGKFAFEYCSKLTHVQLVQGCPKLQFIARGAFYSCSIHRFAETREDDNDDDDVGDYIVQLPASMIAIASFAFEYNNIRGLDLSRATRLREIGERAFYFNYRLSEVKFPFGDNRLEVLGRKSFSLCSSLRSVLNFSYAIRVLTIQEATFERCVRLESIQLPPNLMSIQENAFYYCHSLGPDIVVPMHVTEIGRWAFGECKSTIRVILPERLEAIGDRSFALCFQLTYLHVGSLAQLGNLLLETTNSNPLLSTYNIQSLEFTNRIPTNQWPWFLHHFLLSNGSPAQQVIPANRPQQRRTLVWKFLCRHAPQLLEERE